MQAIEQNDSHCLVKFFTKARQNKAKTAKAGRPIFDQHEFVEIRLAGDKDSVVVAPAHEVTMTVRTSPADTGTKITYAQRFPEEYAAYKRQEEIAAVGTPIEELTALNVAERAELKAVNIITVEALAGLGTTKGLGMNGDRWVDLAKAYLKRAESGKTDAELVEKMKSMEQANATLQDQIKQLMAKLEGGPAPAATAPAAPGAPELAEQPDPDDGAGASDDPVDEVDEAGPFFGYNAQALRDYIKGQTGDGVKGRPSLNTLLSMAKEVLAESTK